MRSLNRLYLSFAFLSAACTHALAADPYAYPPAGTPPNFGAESFGGSAVPMIAQNWSGIYVGGQFGFGWGDVGSGTMNGPLVGGTVGINGQAGPVVFGAEGDGSWANLEGSFNGRDYEMQALGTIRGRVGYAFDRFVAYGTGGAAFAAVEKTSGRTDSATYFGWTAGAGLEVALTANLSAKLEYLYVDLGDQRFNNAGRSVDLTANLVRAGINYRF